VSAKPPGEEGVGSADPSVKMALLSRSKRGRRSFREEVQRGVGEAPGRGGDPAAASLQQAACRSHGEADRPALVSLLRA
jgi:hypothetical protein